ncbi:hypothetical protein SHKM778_90740 [Streptomyces sp. KM77-8]|uniref:AP2/ERF domain-containing protein n=1 Tax=Streptomyces haneummycinicus TaxID=3074435 RepID=A0AAT9HZ14_9ACTN
MAQGGVQRPGPRGRPAVGQQQGAGRGGDLGLAHMTPIREGNIGVPIRHHPPGRPFPGAQVTAVRTKKVRTWQGWELYREHRPVLAALGGTHTHLGEHVGRAAAYDIACGLVSGVRRVSGPT